MMTIKISQSGEMLKKLIKAMDMDDLKNNFYPLLLVHAEKELTIPQFVILLIEDVREYCKDKPAITFFVIFDIIPEFIDAMVDDKKAAEDIKTIFAKVISGQTT